ncbi:MAG: C40 family peptidase [Bacteroidales bacterium]|nr:C40 family peptidase [Bacteroidales bacterium]
MKNSFLLSALTAVILCLQGLVPAPAQTRWAVVDFSTGYLRAAPDYESALETQALMGTVVEVIGEQGYWRQVVQHDPSYVAWATELGLAELDPAGLDAYIAAPKYICTAFLSHVYNRPSSRSEILSELVLGDLLERVIGGKGRAVRSMGYCQVALPDGRIGFVPARDLAPFDEWAHKRSARTSNLEKTARSFLGIPYLWGGVSVKGMDCSGLVWMTYFLNGILLPRNASQQAKCGVEVPLNRLRTGDLIFFGTPGNGVEPDRITHVGMSLGGKEFIHSSHLVRICSLDPVARNYYGNKPALFAVRIVERNGTLIRPVAGRSLRYGTDDRDEYGTGTQYRAIPLPDSPWYF